jgi:hypothetical protein
MPAKKFTLPVVLLILITAVGATRLRPAPGAAEMTASAERFVETLSPTQRSQTLIAYDAPERTDWHYIPKPSRKGLQVKEMDQGQRKAAFELLQSSLSAVGYHKASKIMQLEGILHELEKNRVNGMIRDPERYYFTLFGKPAADARWGLSVEGHHLSLNFVVEGNRVVSSTPTFMGSNPGKLLADYGPEFKKGLRVLADEEMLAFDLLNSLTDEQRKKAVVADKAPNDVRDAGKAAPPNSPAVGLAASEMSAEQVAILQKLISTYANNLPAEVAAERLAKIEADGIASVAFSWQGAAEPGIGHDYRVQGKSFLIEFNNTQPDSAGNPANHVHSVWHDLQGNFAIPVDG